MNYEDDGRLEADCWCTCTAAVSVGDAQRQAPRRFLERGGRWFALHATNAGVSNPQLAEIVGSRFFAHPPYCHFPVPITEPSDQLVQGLEPIEVDDELYLIEHKGDVEALLHWGGEGRGQYFRHSLLSHVSSPSRRRRRVVSGPRPRQSTV